MENLEIFVRNEERGKKPSALFCAKRRLLMPKVVAKKKKDVVDAAPDTHTVVVLCIPSTCESCFHTQLFFSVFPSRAFQRSHNKYKTRKEAGIYSSKMWGFKTCLGKIFFSC